MALIVGISMIFKCTSTVREAMMKTFRIAVLKVDDQTVIYGFATTSDVTFLTSMMHYYKHVVKDPVKVYTNFDEFYNDHTDTIETYLPDNVVSKIADVMDGEQTVSSFAINLSVIEDKV